MFDYLFVRNNSELQNELSMKKDIEKRLLEVMEKLGFN